MVNGLWVPELRWQEISDYLQDCLPEEGCGLVGGRSHGEIARAEAVFPVVNQLHSPVRFRMDPAGQIEALNALDDRGFSLVAIFHSHPAGPETPSPTDLEEFAYPGVLSLIYSPHISAPGWQARAFHLERNSFFEVPVTRLAD